MTRRPLTLCAVLRRQRGWSQADLARAVDVNKWTMAKVEIGAERPSVRVGRELERLFRVPLSRRLAPAIQQ